MSTLSCHTCLNTLDVLVKESRPINEFEYKLLVDHLMVQYNRENEANMSANILWPSQISFSEECISQQDKVQAMYEKIRDLDLQLKNMMQLESIQTTMLQELGKALKKKSHEAKKLTDRLKQLENCIAARVPPSAITTRSSSKKRKVSARES